MLTAYDLLMLVILVIAAVRGAMKGFVWQLAVIGSILLCFGFSETGSIFIAPLLPLESPLNRWVAMLILYVALSFAAFGLARLLHGWIEKLKLKEYDRHLGFLFGAVKGLVLCLVGTFFVVTISAGYRQTVMNSKSGQAAAVVMDRLHPVMPRELHDVLEPYIHQLDQPGLDLKHSHHHHDHGHDHGHPHEPPVANRDQHNAASDIPTAGTVVDKLLEKVRGETVDGLSGIGELLNRAFKNTAPEDRDELLNDIRTAAPEKLLEIAEAWQDGKPIGGPTFPPLEDEVSAMERDWLLDEIVSAFRAGAEASAIIAGVIEGQLSGVPDGVVTAVLRDWHADLFDLTPDPDPATDASLSLDARIVRQLAAAGVPLSTLSAGLQDRLRESRQ